MPEEGKGTWTVEVGLLGAVLVGAPLAADHVDHALMAVGPAEEGLLQARLVEAGPLGAAVRLTLLARHTPSSWLLLW